MNKVIKNIFLFCLCIPGVGFSQSSEDLAREIFIDDVAKKESADLKELFDEQREDFIKLYEPLYGVSEVSPEIVAMEEQLYMDVVSSNVFKFDPKELEELLVNNIVSMLTYEELLELREINQRPVFKKLDRINEVTMKATQLHMDAWQKDNLKLIEYFVERNERKLMRLEELIELRKKDRDKSGL
ncbi:hypothetical protein ACJJIQ_09555 [Microbulbifer sp. ANSA003]|uniref:hypothetical protein n=1 Tax=Microbulbifer sp. ANSA003 TaxID=3243360 RepID=UPI004042F213